MAQAAGVRVILALDAKQPWTHGSAAFCSWAAQVAATASQWGINDYIVWNPFHGTGQPTTLNGLTFRIDELGWQTDTWTYPQYYNAENVKTVSEQTQAADIATSVQKYLACDPTVTDVDWFLTRGRGDAKRTRAGRHHGD